jgi:hypothetical protein
MPQIQCIELSGLQMGNWMGALVLLMWYGILFFNYDFHVLVHGLESILCCLLIWCTKTLKVLYQFHGTHFILIRHLTFFLQHTSFHL